MTKHWEMDYSLENITESDTEEILYAFRYSLLPAENRSPVWAEYHYEDGNWLIRCADVPAFYALCRQEMIADWMSLWAARHNTICGGGIREVDDGEEEPNAG